VAVEPIDLGDHSGDDLGPSRDAAWISELLAHPWLPLAAALVIGALPGARLGWYWSHRTRADRLLVVLGVVISLVALRMWVSILPA
jgi:uncharacterized membrane protein YfcA